MWVLKECNCFNVWIRLGNLENVTICDRVCARLSRTTINVFIRVVCPTKSVKNIKSTTWTFAGRRIRRHINGSSVRSWHLVVQPTRSLLSNSLAQAFTYINQHTHNYNYLLITRWCPLPLTIFIRLKVRLQRNIGFTLLLVLYALYFATSAQQYSSCHTHRLQHKATITIHKDKDTQYKQEKIKT